MKSLLHIAVGGDHGGYQLKDALAAHLRAQGHEVDDCGTHSKEAVDYPRIAHSVARKVADGEAEIGIIVDGAGIGSAMAANKVRGIRAAACYNEALAANSRVHNGANILTLGSGQTTLHAAKRIVDIFLSSACTEERHLRRVQLIKDIETGHLEPGPPAPAASAPAGKEENVELSATDVQRVAQRVRQLAAAAGLQADISSAVQMSPRDLAQMIDHTMLKPDASNEDIAKLCAEAAANDFWSVCVNSSYARFAKNELRGSNVKLCCVVGFPLGAMPPDIKAAEARKAIREGAQEIDMVINIGALKNGDDKLVLEDIRAVVEACRDGRALSKVILETALLTDEEKVLACQLSMRAGADFVKTSTGFSSGGATPQDVALMSSVVSSKGLGVKASGGVRTYKDAITMIEAGASRLGCSSGAAIIEEAKALAEGRDYVPEMKAKGDY